MRPSLAAAGGNVVGQTLTPALPLIGAVPARPVPTVAELRRGYLCVCADEAITATVGRKVAAATLGISESVLSRKLGMQDGKCLNLDDLGALGPEVVLDFADRLRDRHGANSGAERLQRAMNLIAQGVAAIVSEASR